MEIPMRKNKLFWLLHTCVNLGCYIGTAFAAFRIALFIAFPFLPESLVQQGSFGIIVNGFSISVQAFEQIGNEWLPICLAALSVASGATMLWLYRALLNSFAAGSPFTAKNAKLLLWMGILFFAQAYATQGFNFILAQGFSHMPLEQLSIRAYFSLLPEGTLLALGLVVLAAVFRYGKTLQEEHDNTV